MCDQGHGSTARSDSDLIDFIERDFIGRRSQRLVVRTDSRPAICWAISRRPPLMRHAAIPVAREDTRRQSALQEIASGAMSQSPASNWPHPSC